MKRIIFLEQIGENILDVLRENGVFLPAPCGGRGRCGKCKVRLYRGIVEGTGKVVPAFGDAVPKEVLACQAKLLTNCEIELPECIDGLAEESGGRAGWKQPECTDGLTGTVGGMSKSGLERMQMAQKEDSVSDCGVAIDIGTTNIKFAKVRYADGIILQKYACPNSQAVYGADVMSRILAACAGKGQALSALIWKDLKKGISALGGAGRISVACNTTMLSLLCGYPLDGMKEHPFTPYCLEAGVNGCVDISAALHRDSLQEQESDKDKDGCVDVSAMLHEDSPQQNQTKAGLPLAVCAPCAGAFIGGDIVAGLLAVPFGQELSLLIDLGTNGEMVLGTENAMLAASVAAGPAFESGDWFYGSDAVEALAEAYRKGAVDETGLLVDAYFETGYPFYINGSSKDAGQEPGMEQIPSLAGMAESKQETVPIPGLTGMAEPKQETIQLQSPAGILTQENIRDLQLAKAAVRTGIEYLAEEYAKRYINGDEPAASIEDDKNSGIRNRCAENEKAALLETESRENSSFVLLRKVKHVYLAGGMGVMSEKACLDIGMLPPEFAGRVHFVGNTSLAGAIRLLTEAGAYQKMKEIAARVTELELAAWERFDETYVAYMNLPEKRNLQDAVS